MSKALSQSASHTHRNSGRAEAAGQVGSLTNNLLHFQNTVRKAAQHSHPSLENVDKTKLRTHPLCGFGWHA